MERQNQIRWGIVGCGDVCEMKSGPAFGKVTGSQLVAVMRRDREKAKDFARRHGVPKFFSDAQELIHDPDVNAVYIATPPAFHEKYAIAAMEAGKPVYIEKPVALDSASCERIMEASNRLNVKSCVAHYRRALPLFKKVKELLSSGIIGKPSLVLSRTLQDARKKINSADYWRTDPDISGGGLFFDLAPHQLDILYWLFGSPRSFHGVSLNQARLYPAPDLTALSAILNGNIFFHGTWAFNVDGDSEQEITEIFGEKGKLSFSFFRLSGLDILSGGETRHLAFDFPENIQLPMIDEVVKYFRGSAPNPCPLEDALATLRMMDSTYPRQAV